MFAFWRTVRSQLLNARGNPWMILLLQIVHQESLDVFMSVYRTTTSGHCPMNSPLHSFRGLEFNLYDSGLVLSRLRNSFHLIPLYPLNTTPFLKVVVYHPSIYNPISTHSELASVQVRFLRTWLSTSPLQSPLALLISELWLLVYVRLPWQIISQYEAEHTWTYLSTVAYLAEGYGFRHGTTAGLLSRGNLFP